MKDSNVSSTRVFNYWTTPEYYDYMRDAYPRVQLIRFSDDLLIVELFFASLALLINIIVVAFLIQLRCKGSLKATLKFVLSLAICDINTSFIHIVRQLFFLDTIWDIYFKSIETIPKRNFIDGSICPAVVSYLYMAAQTVALATMMFIAVDVLILVKWPLRYALIIFPRKATVLVVASWIVSCLLWAGIALIALIEGTVNSITAGAPYLFTCTVPMIACFVAFIVIYAIIICNIRTFVSRAPSGQSRALVKSVVTVACVLLTYIVCNMPYVWFIIIVVMMLWQTETQIPLSIYYWIAILRCLFVFNSTCNPIIYSIRMPELRNKFRNMFNTIKKMLRIPGRSHNSEDTPHNFDD